MIRDLLLARPDSTSIPDVCIVGAGAAGITLAVELARLNLSVTLLEAGGPQVEEIAQDPYRSESIGLPYRGLVQGRFRALGGTTTRWGGQTLPLQSFDFASRPWLPESGWPIAIEALEPHYARALELEGLAKSQSDQAVWQSLKLAALPALAAPPAGNHLSSCLSRWCPQPDFAKLHGSTLAHSPRIVTWLNANAVELLLQDQAVTGVRCRTHSGVEAIFRARTYVFALGAIECNRFFLQPLKASLPWNLSGLLGRHFKDHIDSDAATVIPRNLRRFHEAFDTIFLAGLKYTPKLTLKPEAQRSAEILNVGATVYSAAEQTADTEALKTTARNILHGNLRALTPAPLLHLLAHAPAMLARTYRYAVQHRAWHAANAAFRLRVHCEQEPASQSSITLSAQRDSFGLLRSRLDWQISPLELRSIQHFVKRASQSLAGIADVIPHPCLAAGTPFLSLCEDGFNPMGGMRMHPSPAHGVVDNDLKLHGTQNCFVCSSAVFPTGGFSNPTHTLIALASRLAVHLAHHHAAAPFLSSLQYDKPTHDLSSPDKRVATLAPSPSVPLCAPSHPRSNTHAACDFQTTSHRHRTVSSRHQSDTDLTFLAGIVPVLSRTHDPRSCRSTNKHRSARRHLSSPVHRTTKPEREPCARCSSTRRPAPDQFSPEV